MLQLAWHGNAFWLAVLSELRKGKVGVALLEAPDVSTAAGYILKLSLHQPHKQVEQVVGTSKGSGIGLDVVLSTPMCRFFDFVLSYVPLPVTTSGVPAKQ